VIRFPLRALPLLLGLAVGVALLAALLHSVDPSSLAKAFRLADYRYVAAAAVPFVLIVAVKVVRWELLFGSEAPSFGILFGALNAGYAINTLVPLRLGELVTAYWVRDKTGLSMVRVLSTVAVERVADGLTVFAILMLSAPSVAFPRRLVAPALTIGVLLTFALAALLFVAYSEGALLDPLLARLDTTRLRLAAALARQAVTGLHALRDRRALVFFGLYTLVIWLSNAVLLWLMVRAFHIDAPLGAGFLLTGVLYLGMAVPSSPGYIGVFDYLMVLALSLYGAAHSAAVAAALATHFVNFVPVTVVGLAFLGRHGLSRALRSVRTAPEQSTAPPA
jgi:uncharacterized protein (TIRG00374 family)